MIVTPSYNARNGGIAADQDLEQASDSPKLDLMKDAIDSVSDMQRDYYNRNVDCRNWWRARWDGQTVDARKPFDENTFPFPGAADTRIRLCERLVREHGTIGRYALLNAKVQAKSSRPLATMRESQQATQLLNWMLYTHMASEIYREQDLMLSCRHVTGSAVTAVEWDQERRLEYIPVSMMSLADFVQRVGKNLVSDTGYGMRDTGKQSDQQLAMQFISALAQTPQPILELQDMIMDPAYEADLGRVIQSMSPVVTKRGAEKILRDLRELRTAEVPLPYVFKSRARRTTLRPMIDVVFPAMTDDLQRAKWIARFEPVSAVELEDRIETAGYDPGFVDQAKKQRGPVGMGDMGFGMMRDGFGQQIIGPSGRSPYSANRKGSNDWADDIWLTHFYMLVQDRGVPILFDTVFHMDIDVAAKHAPCEYAHGQQIFHGHRFETDERPIISSRGIPEIAYTWEMELKKQRDGRTDRVDLVLRPPILTTAYEELKKFSKSLGIPGSLVPMRRFDTIEKDKPPMWDPGSIEIDKTIQQTVDEFFWGGADTVIRQQRYQEVADAVLAEEKPIIMQTWQLIQQYLPSAKVARVVGPLQRPFEVDREEIQGQFDITATVDVRQMDPDFLKQFVQFATVFAGLDTIGVADRRELLIMVAEAFSYDMADRVIKPGDTATQQEVQDEQKTVDLIMASGIDQPFPKSGNYQLRLSTAQQRSQELLGTNPVVQRRVSENPEIMQVLQKRLQGFQENLQQQQNAQIGRGAMTTQTFSRNAPQLQDMGGMQN